MAKGDMGQSNPNNLAMIVSRMKSAQGGGQMGPGQFMGPVPRMPQQPGVANMQLYPNPSVGLQARPMMGGFGMPNPGAMAQSANETVDPRIQVGRLGTESNPNTGIAGMNSVRDKRLEYLG